MKVPENLNPPRFRKFVLVRDEDETGLSGTGVVAFGVVFPDGTVATRWNATIAQTCTWASIEHVEHVHGHNGKTRIVYVDGE